MSIVGNYLVYNCLQFICTLMPAQNKLILSTYIIIHIIASQCSTMSILYFWLIFVIDTRKHKPPCMDKVSASFRWTTVFLTSFSSSFPSSFHQFIIFSPPLPTVSQDVLYFPFEPLAAQRAVASHSIKACQSGGIVPWQVCEETDGGVQQKQMAKEIRVSSDEWLSVMVSGSSEWWFLLWWIVPIHSSFMIWLVVSNMSYLPPIFRDGWLIHYYFSGVETTHQW